MLKYIQRMETEKSDLEGKIKRAAEALHEADKLHLDETQKELLQGQLDCMRGYNRILASRIAYEKKLHGE